MIEEEDKIVQKTSRIRLIGRADRYWSGAEIFAYFTRQIPVGVT